MYKMFEVYFRGVLHFYVYVASASFRSGVSVIV